MLRRGAAACSWRRCVLVVPLRAWSISWCVYSRRFRAFRPVRWDGGVQCCPACHRWRQAGCAIARRGGRDGRADGPRDSGLSLCGLGKGVATRVEGVGRAYGLSACGGAGGSLGPCVQATCTRAVVARSRHAGGSVSAWSERPARGCALVAGDHQEASRWCVCVFWCGTRWWALYDCILEWVRP